MSAPAFNSNAGDLLRRLDPVVRPRAAVPLTDGGAAAPTPFESRGFDDLLSQAMSGAMRSDRAMHVAAELQPGLHPDQLDRLACAADRAEANGSRRALMMLDGRGLEVDVATREVVSELRPNDDRRVLRVDAAMVVPSSPQESRERGPAFAGINDLTAARLASATIAPKPRG